MQARRAIVAFASLTAASLTASRARPAAAVEAGPPVVASLVVTGPADCAARAEVVKQVARRSSRIRFADGAAAGPELRVAVEAAAPRAVTAALSIAWPTGSRSERQLTVPTCAEAADAIALVIVLALDPAAAAREPSAPAARPPVPPPVVRTAEPPPPAPSRERPASEPPAAKPTAKPTPPPTPTAPSPPPPAPSPPPPAPSPPPTDDRAATPPPPTEPAPPLVRAAAPPPAATAPSPPPVHRLDVGAQVRFADGPAPVLMPGLALTGGWERDTASVLSLTVRLIVARHGLDGWYGPGGTAAFTLDLATLHLCPLSLGSRDGRARLCASATAGRMVAESMDNLSPRTRSRPFFGVGGAAVLSALPHPRVEVAASIEPQAALIRDQFTFGPNRFHDVPAVVWFFGAGATVTFP